MLITTSIIVLPLVIFLWILEAFILVACVRETFGCLATDWAARAARSLAPILDWAPDYLNHLL